MNLNENNPNDVCSIEILHKMETTLTDIKMLCIRYLDILDDNDVALNRCLLQEMYLLTTQLNELRTIILDRFYGYGHPCYYGLISDKEVIFLKSFGKHQKPFMFFVRHKRIYNTSFRSLLEEIIYKVNLEKKYLFDINKKIEDFHINKIRKKYYITKITQILSNYTPLS
jgi:hypothetical protein